MPLEASWMTLPGVSLPSRVVRSHIRIARWSAASLDSRFTDLVARAPARSATPTSSTEGTARRKESIVLGVTEGPRIGEAGVVAAGDDIVPARVPDGWRDAPTGLAGRHGWRRVVGGGGFRSWGLPCCRVTHRAGRAGM